MVRHAFSSARGGVVLVLVAAALVVVGSAPAAVRAAAPSICGDRFGIVRSSKELKVPVCSNRPLRSRDPAVRRLIVIVHGDSRNAFDQLRHIERAAALARSTDTLIVAPQFLVASDLKDKALAQDVLYWTDSAWKQGGPSSTTPYARPWTTAAFAVVDALISNILGSDRFPNLNAIVVAGHSAGGQFVNRYSALDKVTAAVAARSATLSFVVANPSSFLYLDSQRFHAQSGSFKSLSTSERNACPRYDDYKYGLAGAGPSGALSRSSVIRHFKSQHVTYLLGALDVDAGDPQLDHSCQATWQGVNRYDRGVLYQRSLNLTLKLAARRHQRFATVPGVGHEGSAMFVSPQGQVALFTRSGPATTVDRGASRTH